MSEFVKALPGNQGTYKKVRSCGDVYQDCPVFDDGNYCLRLVAEGDAEDLLKVYSDEKAVPFLTVTIAVGMTSIIHPWGK